MSGIFFEFDFSSIGGFHRRKVVAKDWFPNGGDLSVKGKIEMLQQSEYELTNVDVNIKGLLDNSGYHIHITPVEGDLEFPCESSTLYGHFNPRGVDPKTSPSPATGSTTLKPLQKSHTTSSLFT